MGDRREFGVTEDQFLETLQYTQGVSATGQNQDLSDPRETLSTWRRDGWFVLIPCEANTKVVNKRGIGLEELYFLRLIVRDGPNAFPYMEEVTGRGERERERTV